MASKPADEKHPFGHARIEYLSGVIVSFIVIFLGLQLGMSSIEKILTPEENALTPVALVVLVISILAKLWQCLFYRKVGRMIKSESVEATSKDSRNDVIATSVVLLGAVITMLTGVNSDGYMGAAVALFIVFSGVQLTISTADPLLGQAPEGELVQTITEKMLSYPGIIGMHDLAVHNYGVGRCFASAHCEVDAKNDILVSHDLIDNIERDFSRDLCIHMVIHLDPVIVGDARTDALHRKGLRCLHPENNLDAQHLRYKSRRYHRLRRQLLRRVPHKAHGDRQARFRDQRSRAARRGRFCKRTQAPSVRRKKARFLRSPTAN